MTQEINTSIKIQASPEKIWSVLTDFEQYPDWNPFIKSIDGDVETGKTITVKIQPHKSSAMTFKPIVLTRVENKKLSWQGKFLFKGLFDGEHQFELKDHQNGTVTFVHSEIFSGTLVRFFNLEATKTGFQMMNEALKKLAEKTS